jgi:hypothetical protein
MRTIRVLFYCIFFSLAHGSLNKEETFRIEKFARVVVSKSDLDSTYLLLVKPFDNDGVVYENEPACSDGYYSTKHYNPNDTIFLESHLECIANTMLKSEVVRDENWYYERYQVFKANGWISTSVVEIFQENLNWVLDTKPAREDSEYKKWLKYFSQPK